MSRWRYIAQRALTGEILEWELPLDRDDLTWDLSGPGSLRGSVAPDIGTLRAHDGHLLLEEWGTYLYAEADGEIRWGGIVQASGFSGKSWTIEAAGFSSYPTGIPFGGTLTGVDVDPADIVRQLWAHVQSFADAKLGVTVVGTTTTRVGTDSDRQLALATAEEADAKRQREAAVADLTLARTALASRRGELTEATKARTSATRLVTQRRQELAAATKTGNASAIAAAQAALGAAESALAAADGKVVERQAAVSAATGAAADQESVAAATRTGVTAATEKRKTAASAVKDDGGAYKLQWWDAPDVGREIDALAKETPFDYAERHFWDGDTIRHEVRIGHPRLGRRRTDLSFVQGDNVTSVVSPSRDGAGYANEVLGVGAGEGAGALRRTAAVRDGRLRRVAVVSAKDVTSTSRLDAQLRDTLGRSDLGLVIDRVDVRDHPNAAIGSWSVGDDVLIEATLPWLGEVALWHRITSWTLTSDYTATLHLARSDSFTYGG